MSTLSSPRTILVVEDEVLVAVDLAESLRDLGYSVVSVRDADDAPEAGSYDAVLLDHGLSGGASERFADALLAANVPFAFCTGFDGGELKARYPGVPSLEKPYTADGVAAVAHGFFAAERDR